MAELNSSIYIDDSNEETRLTITQYINKLIDDKILDSNKEKYYIGRIIINTSGTNPFDYLGFGEWENYGSGKVLVGLNPDDTDFNTVGKTGGTKTVTLTEGQMPQHTHTFTGNSHSHSLNSHTHSIDITSGNQSANHTHSVGAHSHGLNSHTHSFSATSGSTTVSASTNFRAVAASSNISNQWDILGSLGGSNSNITITEKIWSGSHGVVQSHTSGNASNPKMYEMKISVPHTHSVSGTTEAAYGSTANSTAFNTGSNSVNHTHSVSGVSGAASGNTRTATQTGTNSNTGEGEPHNNLQPYIVVYFWRRIA